MLIQPRYKNLLPIFLGVLFVGIMAFLVIVGGWSFKTDEIKDVSSFEEFQAVFRDDKMVQKLAIAPENFNPDNIVKSPFGGEVSSDIISISFKDGVTINDRKNLITGFGATIVGEVPLPGDHFYHIKFAKPRSFADLQELIRKLEANNQVKTASYYPIDRLIAQFPPTTDVESLNSLTFVQNWWFYDIGLPAAWKKIRDGKKDLSTVVVAVIDSGIDLSHSDLKANILTQYNGVNVWDFGDNDGDVSHDSPNGEPHGTEVAGTIAATINGIGINGGAPTAYIFPIKAEQKTNPGYFGNTDLAINLATAAKVDVINMSFGKYRPSFEEYRKTSQYASIRTAASQGIILVAAASNDSISSDLHFPSGAPEVIAVGATNVREQRAYFSNFSDNPDALWIAAPGEDVYTTFPGNAYEIVSGTSFSSPIVAGVAALLKQIGASSSQIASILKSTANSIPVSYPDGSAHTWKLVNAERAVQNVLGGPVSEGGDSGGPAEVMVGQPFELSWTSKDCNPTAATFVGGEKIDVGWIGSKGASGRLLFPSGLQKADPNYEFVIACYDAEGRPVAGDKVILRVLPRIAFPGVPATPLPTGGGGGGGSTPPPPSPPPPPPPPPIVPAACTANLGVEPTSGPIPLITEYTVTLPPDIKGPVTYNTDCGNGVKQTFTDVTENPLKRNCVYYKSGAYTVTVQVTGTSCISPVVSNPVTITATGSPVSTAPAFTIFDLFIPVEPFVCAGGDFKSTPPSIIPPQSSLLSWGCPEARTCTGTGFSTGGITSGSIKVSPITNTTYGLSCADRRGRSFVFPDVTVKIFKPFIKEVNP